MRVLIYITVGRRQMRPNFILQNIPIKLKLAQKGAAAQTITLKSHSQVVYASIFLS